MAEAASKRESLTRQLTRQQTFDPFWSTAPVDPKPKPEPEPPKPKVDRTPKPKPRAIGVWKPKLPKVDAANMCPHAPKSFHFQTAHLCYQDRISKEMNRLIAGQYGDGAIPIQHGRSPRRSEGLPRQIPGPGLGAKREGYVGMDSSKMATALGPQYWAASGGLHSEYKSMTGVTKKDRAEESWGDVAAANQVSAVRQRGEGTLLRVGQMESRELEEARLQGRGTLAHLVDQMQQGAPPMRAASEPHLSPERAHQMAAMRQRGVGTIIRVGKMSKEELDNARGEGHGSLVWLAEEMKGSADSPRLWGRGGSAGAGSDQQRALSAGGGGSGQRRRVERLLVDPTPASGELGIAAAHQQAAIRQRGAGTLLRLAKMSPEEMAQARADGRGTIVTLAQHMQRKPPGGSKPQQIGRQTLLHLPIQ
eukprot:TRINITY_DN22926_c0_g1_i1.p1 TRINITY_DN22926_c0_g1~~TRINITY_DN22926_c0_g1_i1.p1  ORF type:complete len:420 (-),score=85.31 TRINITY_DN22926_c0_g1_i1:103-1362(-)